MNIVADLHSHSGHAGGVGAISLAKVAQIMKLKGIDIYGTGDVLQPEWNKYLQNKLQEAEDGLFCIEESKTARFLLQTEIIITAPAPDGGRKTVHTIILFPDFSATEKAMKYLQDWQVKINMGRPFLKCTDKADVSAKMFKLTSITDDILIIPAHVLTPQGIYGAERPVNCLADFYGEFSNHIYAVETGLSADPQILALIPELDQLSLISNSDCHSAALNRIGREFTSYKVKEKSYKDLVNAIKNHNITYTAEFTPSEGRYFLTGHRAGKRGHNSKQYCYFSPDKSPQFCPICGKPMTMGVLERALQLSKIQGETRTLANIIPKQQYKTLIPLTEVIAAGFGIKNASAKKVLKEFKQIIDITETEERLWQMNPEKAERFLANSIHDSTMSALIDIMQGNYSFTPLGFDGEYGQLTLGSKTKWFGHEVIHGQINKRLF